VLFPNLGDKQILLLKQHIDFPFPTALFLTPDAIYKNGIALLSLRNELYKAFERTFLFFIFMTVFNLCIVLPIHSLNPHLLRSI
jgi:hypothetical protein